MSVPDLFTVEQVAELCQVHPKTIRRAIREHGLRASKVADRGCWIIRAADLDAWLDERANRPRDAVDRPVAPRPAVPARRAPRAGDGRLTLPPRKAAA